MQTCTEEGSTGCRTSEQKGTETPYSSKRAFLLLLTTARWALHSPKHTAPFICLPRSPTKPPSQHPSPQVIFDLSQQLHSRGSSLLSQWHRKHLISIYPSTARFLLHHLLLLCCPKEFLINKQKLCTVYMYEWLKCLVCVFQVQQTLQMHFLPHKTFAKQIASKNLKTYIVEIHINLEASSYWHLFSLTLSWYILYYYSCTLFLDSLVHVREMSRSCWVEMTAVNKPSGYSDSTQVNTVIKSTLRKNTVAANVNSSKTASWRAPVSDSICLCCHIRSDEIRFPAKTSHQPYMCFQLRSAIVPQQTKSRLDGT